MMAKPASETPRHPLFLWKVTGGRGTVFLLGSIHAATADFYPLPRPIEDDFRKSSVLVEEIDFSKVDPAQFRQLITEKGTYAAGDGLENHISPETRAAFQKFLKQTGQNPSAFSQMRPWLASIMIILSELNPEGINSKYGVDIHFMHEASEAHKATSELESPAFQIKLFSDLPDDLQSTLLLSSLLEAQKTRQYFDILLRAWRTGDARKIEDLLTRDAQKYPQLKTLYDKLIFARNRKMAERIAVYLDTPKTYFVVVGVGHLIGSRGLVALLRDKQYRVERVSAE
ncbi:MAG TPA: TraB/GumN family protein [Stellaceae bacterium]|nr:TraB/GumN family protein [Stellaceae bacterium]